MYAFGSGRRKGIEAAGGVVWRRVLVCVAGLAALGAGALGGCSGAPRRGPMVIDASGRAVTPGEYATGQGYGREGRYGGAQVRGGVVGRSAEYGVVSDGGQDRVMAARQATPEGLVSQGPAGSGQVQGYGGQYGEGSGYGGGYARGDRAAGGQPGVGQWQGRKIVRVYYRRDPQHPLANEDGYVAEYVLEEPSGAPPRLGQVAGWQGQATAGQGYYYPAGENGGGVGRPVVAGVSVSEVGRPTSPAIAEVMGKVVREEPGQEGRFEGGTGLTVVAEPLDEGPGRSAAVHGGGGGLQPPVQVTRQGRGTVARRAVPVVKVLEAESTDVRELTRPAVAQGPGGQALQGQRPYDREEIVAAVERFVAEQGGNVAGQLALRCLYAAYGQDDKACRELPNVPEWQQEESAALARAMLLAARVKLDESRNDPDLANDALEALDGLRGEIAERADLVVSKLKLCSEVEGFGRYEVVPEGALASGQARNLIVYCELNNFSNKLNADGRYVTELSSEITLYDEDFRVVAQRRDDVTDLPCHNPRRDFFLRGPIPVPRLSPGKYQLEVVIRDKVAGKIARPKRVEFEVVAEGQRAR